MSTNTDPLPLPTYGQPKKRPSPLAVLSKRLANIWQIFFPPRADTLRPAVEGHLQPAPKKIKLSRRLTPAELAERKRQREQELQRYKEQGQWLKEADIYARVISKALEARGVRHKLETRNSTRAYYQVVKFLHPKLSDDGKFICLKVDTRPSAWPHGHSLEELHAPENIDFIQARCEREVTFWRSSTNGCGYRIHREQGTASFPSFVDYDEIWTDLPASYAKDSWTFSYGRSHNAKAIFRSVPDEGNMIIAGTPNFGKSNFVNQLVCRLAENNEPYKVNFIFIDLKGFLEGDFFSRLPHVAEIPRLFIKRNKQNDDDPVESLEEEFKIVKEDPPTKALIDQPYAVPGTLLWLYREIKRRQRIIKEANCKKVSEYNQKAHASPNMRYLPLIICIIDEWSVVRGDERIGAMCERILATNCNTGRALGVYTWICTQTPTRDTLSAKIINAANTKVVFRMADQYMSMALIGSQRATEFHRAGHGYIRSSNFDGEVQVPYIDNAKIISIVDGIVSRAGRVEAIRRTHDVSFEDICKWALEERSGYLGWEPIWKHFQDRGLSAKKTQGILRAWEGKTITLGNTQYTVEPEVQFPRRMPRRLLAVGDGTLPPADTPPPDVEPDDVPGVTGPEPPVMYPADGANPADNSQVTGYQ